MRKIISAGFVVIFFFITILSCSPAQTALNNSAVEITAQSSSIPLEAAPLPSDLFLPVMKPVKPSENRISPENITDLTFLRRFGQTDQKLIWSPDNTKFFLATSETIEIYDAATITLQNSVHLSKFWDTEAIPDDFYLDAETGTISPNGKILAFSSYRRGADILLLDAATLDFLQYISLDQKKLTKIVFSADGSSLIGIINNGKQNGDDTWNVITYQINSRESSPLFEEDLVSSLFALSPDAGLYISGEYRSPLTLWNSQTGETIATFNSQDRVDKIAFSPDQQYIATSDGDNTVTIWDLSGIPIASISTGREWNPIIDLAFSPDQALLAITNWQGYIDIYDLKSQALLKTLDTEYEGLNIAFNPDGSILSATASLTGTAFWTTSPDVLTSVSTARQPDKEIKQNYASLPPGGYILYTEGNGMSVISQDGSFQQEISDSLKGIPISVDGRILSTMNYSYANDYSGFINLISGETVKMEHLGVISPDLKWVAETDFCDPLSEDFGIEGISTKANTSFCTDVDELKRTETEKVNEGVSRIKWSPDASRLAFLKVTWPKPEHSDEDWSLLLSNGLYTMDASCFQDPRTCDQKTKLAVFNPYKGISNTTDELYLNWSADGDFVVLNNGQMFIVFDLRNETAWKLDKTSAYLENEYQYFGISPDNKWIAYSGDRTNILLLPFTGGDEIEIASGLENVQVLGWIMAPLLENNAAFKVLPAGDHARIRRTADIEGIQTGTLYTGNTFTVIEGPVQADGYTWWYIHSKVDGVEGWVTEFYGRYEKVESGE